MATLAEFLRDGRLGPLRLAQSQEDVRKLLGAPDGETDDNPADRTWKYQDLQIGFSGGRVTLLAIYPSEPATTLPAAIAMTGPVPQASMAKERFAALALAAKINLTEDKELSFDAQLCLVSPGRVRIFFAGSGLQLQSLQLALG